ncbi:DEAD/DEAH box helicase [Pseudomonas simiae]|uniref:DEAD/DEAH box helicase n=1 Tax=Pseudomonas simiae TaxID=321846 RepID=UPI00209548BB|nr:DEAD/DEAH box helicase [Pseudomonas simiae]
MLNLHYENNTYICKTIYDLKDYPKSAGFNWSKPLTAWVTPSFVNVLNLIESLKESEEGYTTTPDFDYQSDIAETELNKRLSASSKTSSQFVVPAPIGLHYLPYQKAGIEYAVAKGNALIADEMGLGKTIQAIGVINFQKSKKILIVCPATLKSNWKRELKKWLVNPELSKSASVLTSKSKIDTHREYAADVINYDILGKQINSLTAQNYDYIIFDESHYLKNPKANRTISALSIPCKNFIALTGTPFLNNPYEIFTIANKLAPESFKSYGSFGYRYCSGIFDTKIAPHFLINLNELQTKLKEAGMIRRLKKDVLAELPDKIHSVVPMPCDHASLKIAIKGEMAVVEKAHKLYEGIIKTMSKYDPSHMVYRAAAKDLADLRGNFLSQLMLVRKISAVAKAPLVAEYIIEAVESQGKVVFFAHHQDVLDLIESTLHKAGLKTVRIDGKVPTARRQELVDEFQNGDAQVFIGSIKACAEGITLTAASTVMFGEMDWTPAKMVQCEDRCHRIGQKDTVNVVNLVIENSIDDFLSSILHNKNIVISKLLDEGDDQDAEYISYDLFDLFKHFGLSK